MQNCVGYFLTQASLPCFFYDEAYVVQNIGGFLIPNKIQPREYSKGSEKDDILHKRAQPRQPAQRLVLQLERQQVVPELEQPRQRLERQLSRRSTLNVSSFYQTPSLFVEGVCV